jgi:hypothetical protein
MFLLNHVRAGTGSRGPPPLALGDVEAKINCLGRIWFRERGLSAVSGTGPGRVWR